MADLRERKTLAEEIGNIPHISLLLKKTKRLGLELDELAELAHERGCFHYPGNKKAKKINKEVLTNTELTVALLNSANVYSPWLIRVGAQLMGSKEIEPKQLIRLAKTERSCEIIDYICDCAEETEPEEKHWKEIRDELKKIGNLKQLSKNKRAELFPHPSRFRSDTGITRNPETKKIERIWKKNWLWPSEK